MAGYSGNWDDQLVPKGPLGFVVPGLRNLATGANLTPEQLDLATGMSGGGFMPPSTPPTVLGPHTTGPLEEAPPIVDINGIMPPETPAPSVMPQMPTVILPPSNAPKSALDVAKEDAMAEYNAWKTKIDTGLLPTHGSAVMPSGKIVEGTQGGFGLSPLFFANHPEVTGGVTILGDKGPQFLFHENKAQNSMSGVNDLVGQLSAKAAEFISSSFKPTGDPLYDAKVLSTILTQMPSMMTAQTGAGLMPSQIAQNMANANRPQLGIFPTGQEGQHGGFLVTPGGQPQQFTSGTPALSERNTVVGLIHQASLEFAKEAAKIDANLLLQPEDKAAALSALQNRFRQHTEGLLTMTGSRTPSKVTDEQYVQMFIAKNTNKQAARGQNLRALAMLDLQNAKRLHPELFQ